MVRPEASVGKTVRVYYNGDDSPAVEGTLVAVCPEPVLIIDDAEGVRHYFAASLRREVQHVEWLPA